MKTCPTCKSQIDSGASTCPKCGRQFTTLGGIFIAVIVALIIGGCVLQQL
jgi:RNA polymerase subunit RPABC4/transcription elongation factor Spt4